MAITVGTDAYVSLTDASAYHTSIRDPTEWDDLSDTVRERLIRLATRIIDAHITFDGSPNADSQSLAWPRSGLSTPSGAELPRTTVPAQIADACAELALALNGTDLEAEQALSDLDLRASGSTVFGGGAIRRVVPSRVIERIPAAWILSASPNFASDAYRV